MNRFPVLFLLLSLFAIPVVWAPAARAQSTGHPFADIVGETIESANVFLLWQETTAGVTRSKQKTYRYDEDLPVDERLNDIPGVADGRVVDGNGRMVVATGRFNEDPYDDVIAAWEGAAQKIELLIPHFDTTAARWNAATSFTVDQAAAGSAADGRIVVETGDLDADGLDEFVLVFLGDDGKIHLEVYDTDGTLTPQLKAFNADETVPTYTGYEFTPFAVTVGDVDGDGRDEIIQVGVDPDESAAQDWAVYFKVYEFVDGNLLNVLARDIEFPNLPGFEHYNMQYAVEAARYRGGETDDFVFLTTFDRRAPSPNTLDDTFMWLLEYDDIAGEFLRYGNNPDNRWEWNAVLSANDMEEIVAISGDLNGDGRDEVIVGVEDFQRIYSVDNVLNFIPRVAVSTQPQIIGSSYDFMSAGDINQDGIDELIVASVSKDASHERLVVNAWSAAASEDVWLVPPVKVATLKNDEEVDAGTVGERRFAIATGSFDGYAFRLGEPLHSVVSDMSQPLVILNAPPIHFDIFDGSEFDINNCYGEVDCSFEAVYTKTSTDATEVTTKVVSDWGTSVGAGVSGSIETAPMGVGGSVNFEAYFDKTFGKNFTNSGTEGETVAVSVEIGAVEDDLIYATVTDYDIWEYPAFHGPEEAPRRFVVAVVPREPEARWFPSKSWSANAYIPDHEVGNILSYPAYTSLDDNPSVDETIQADYTSDTFVLDANTSYNWTLSTETFTTNLADTTRRSGYDTKVDALVRFGRKYDNSDISTHTTTVRDGLSIEIDLGGIEREAGETRYSVTPYAYWADNGALVVDYAVSPELSGSGGPNTWWEDRYGQAADPAFILPWRYDPEKGFGISEEAKRHQTKDVIFDDPQPTVGDTLMLTARVRNFSLVGTSAPVTAHFYVGDPDAGGTPIIGTEDEVFVSTDAPIPAQRWADATMRWVVPDGLPNMPRIYAVLDQDASTPEIHTNNNKGFNILGLSGETSIESPEDEVSFEHVELHPAYPNPFSTATDIEYTIGKPSPVALEVYNVVGQRVAVLADGLRSTGRHSVRWDASRLAAGVYFVTLRVNHENRTRKVVVVE